MENSKGTVGYAGGKGYKGRKELINAHTKNAGTFNTVLLYNEQRNTWENLAKFLKARTV